MNILELAKSWIIASTFYWAAALTFLSFTNAWECNRRFAGMTN
jgi:hypothetical protein